MAWPQRLYASRRWIVFRNFGFVCIRHVAVVVNVKAKLNAVLTHHVNEHRPGDPEWMFWVGPFASLCRDCHEALHGRPVALPYKTDIGLDGQPLDPMHPYWQQGENKWDSTNKKPKRSNT